MRLWHEDLIPLLPRQQLLGQHRECCALRGNGWGKKHATVDYVFTYSPHKLFQYHMLIMQEMEKRGYVPNQIWKTPNYRGKSCPHWDNYLPAPLIKPIYSEHDNIYYQECIKNLATKGITIRN